MPAMRGRSLRPAAAPAANAARTLQFLRANRALGSIRPQNEGTSARHAACDGANMNPVRTRLNRDHQELEALLELLSQAADTCNREALATAWAELEPRLIAHMQAEEQYLLPLLEASHPAEVRRTLLEHGQIRDAIAELGVAVELHAVRKSDIQAMVERLRAHAKQEDEELYVLAGDKASGAVEHGVLTTLKAVVRSALRSAS
jgi:hypothetical protein